MAGEKTVARPAGLVLHAGLRSRGSGSRARSGGRRLGEYLLGSDSDELRRLKSQHQAWRREARSLWKRAGFASGNRLLDLGCGPGFASIELAHIVGSEGLVLAIDESQRFIDFLETEKSKLRLGQIETRVERVEQLRFADGTFDGAFARWLFCFLQEPEAVVARVAAALRAGGVFAVQDYFNYRALALVPRSPAFDRVIPAVSASWRQSGGDLEIGSRLPTMLIRHGLRLREVRPLTRLVRPGSSLWTWAKRFFFGYVPRLVEAGLLGLDEQSAFEREWCERERDPGAFLYTPPVIDLIGEKAG